MRQVLNLARREYRGYFDHPTAYVLVVAFLALSLFLTFRTLYGAGFASMRGLFDLLPWLLAVFVPAITMRSLAEERRSGTLEWLAAQPVTEVDVVGGKFLGNWLFVLTALAGTVPTSIGVLLVSEADAGIMLAQYVGAALLAAQLVGIGLFASAATRNQITAFVMALAIGFALILLGLPVTTMALPPTLVDASLRLAILEHFEGIARGVLDLRDVLYFVSMGAFFLSLAYLLLARERLSAHRGALKRLRVGIAAFAVVVLVVNLLGSRIHGRLDLTRDDLFTLSPGTRRVIENLDDIVTIKLIVSRELPPEISLTLRDVRDMLTDLRRVSDGRIRVMELHPDEDPEVADEAGSLGITPIQFNVMRDDEFQIVRGWLGLAVLYADKEEVIPFIDRTTDLEYRLAAMISSMTADERPKIAFLTGFGARSPYEFSVVNEGLRQRYEVSTVSLATESDSATSFDDYDVVMLVAPREPISESAFQRLRTYLDNGGSAMIFAETTGIDQAMLTTRPVETGLQSFLEGYGIELQTSLVFDVRSNRQVTLGQTGIFNVITNYPYWPVVMPASEHTVTRGLNGVTMAWVSPIAVRDSSRVQPLLQTTEAGGSRPAGVVVAPEMPLDVHPDDLTTMLVAVAVETGQRSEDGAPTGRLVVVGDADLMGDTFVNNSPENLAFIANAVDWLAQDESLIAIRSKNRAPPPLVFESDATQAMLKWGNLVGMPLLFVLLGGARVVGRRRLAGRRWQEEAA